METNTLYERWRRQARGDDALVEELEAIRGREEEINDRFYRALSFGTAGLRGVLGAGANRMNIYTVGQATQGLAHYLREKQLPGDAAVAIAYDSRINSERFAREIACVLGANGIKAWLFRELMPTPALSYAVRALGCRSGIVVTASHNPAEYNGYKVYDETGCQIGQRTADSISAHIAATDIFDGVKRIPFAQGVEKGLIETIPEKLIQRYIDRVLEEQIHPGICKGAGLKVVYTPLNGAGRRCVLETLASAGVEDIAVVKEQEWPDGHFPTCPYPNPELAETLALGLQLCREKEADLLLATDPDCDRVAAAVREGEDYRIITGNEMGVLLLDYIAAGRLAQGHMPANPVAVMSIVSTSMAEKIAAHYGVELRRVLTGFKFIGEQIRLLEEAGEGERYIFGFEESCGYLSGGYVRDKDAVNAAMLICEMAASYAKAGYSIAARLDTLYRQFGCYRNQVESFLLAGADGMAQMNDIMARLRANPPAVIGEFPVESVSDYEPGQKQTGDEVTPLTLPRSNVLEYALGAGGRVIVRPSGTEPKLKVYYMLAGESFEAADKKYETISRGMHTLLQI